MIVYASDSEVMIYRCPLDCGGSQAGHIYIRCLSTLSPSSSTTYSKTTAYPVISIHMTTHTKRCVIPHNVDPHEHPYKRLLLNGVSPPRSKVNFVRIQPLLRKGPGGVGRGRLKSSESKRQWSWRIENVDPRSHPDAPNAQPFSTEP